MKIIPILILLAVGWNTLFAQDSIDFSKYTDAQLKEFIYSTDKFWGYEGDSGKLIDYVVSQKRSNLILDIFLSENVSAWPYCFDKITAWDDKESIPMFIEMLKNDDLWASNYGPHHYAHGGGGNVRMGMFHQHFIEVMAKKFPSIKITFEMLMSEREDLYHKADIEGRKKVIRQLEEIIHPHEQPAPRQSGESKFTGTNSASTVIPGVSPKVPQP